MNKINGGSITRQQALFKLEFNMSSGVVSDSSEFSECGVSIYNRERLDLQYNKFEGFNVPWTNQVNGKLFLSNR